MTEVDAGRLVLEVVGDTTGLGRDVQAKADAELKNVRARIKAEIDTRSLIADAKRAAAEAGKAAKMKVKAEVDRTALKRDLDKALRETRASVGVKLTVDRAAFQRDLDATLRATKPSVGVQLTVDRTALQRNIETATRSIRPSVKVDVDAAEGAAAAAAELDAATRGRKASIEADVDQGSAAEAEAELDTVARDRKTTITPDVDPGGAGAKAADNFATKLMGGGKIAAFVGLIGTAIPLVVQLAGGLFSVAAAGSQAVGVLAIIPNLVGAAAQGIGVLVAGFMGIGDAVKALGAAQTSAAADSQAAAQAQQAAADAVRSARESLANATENVARTEASGAAQIVAAENAVAQARDNAAQAAKDGAAAVVQAERSLSDAEYNAQRAIESVRSAQEALNQAREDAKSRIEDLALAEDRANLDARGAVLAVAEARKRLNDVNRDPTSTALERKEARLAYDEAIQSLKEIRERNEDLRKEKRQADKEGVKGADNVKAAEDNVAAAIHNRQQAMLSLRDAQKNVAEVEQQAAEAQIAAAQAIIDAQKNLGTTRADAAYANQQAVQGQTDAERNLHTALLAQADAAGLTSASQQKLALAMDNLSPAGQRFARFVVGTLMPRLKDLRLAIQQALLPAVQNGVEKALPFIDTLQKALVGTAHVVGPIIQRLGRILGSSLFNRQAAQIMGANNQALRDFGDAFISLFKAGTQIAQAAIPLLRRFSGWIKDSADNFRGLVDANVGKGGRGDLRVWLKEAGDRAAQLGRIIGNAAKAIFGLGKAAVPAGDQLLGSLDATLKRYSDFANSDAGQTKLREGFLKMVKPTQAVGRVLESLTKLLASIGSGGSTATTAFLDTLTLALRGLNAAAKVPFLGNLITGLLALGGTAGGIAFLSGGILKMAGNISKVSKATGLVTLMTGAWNSFRAAVLGAKLAEDAVTLASIRNSIVTKAQAVATGIASAATTLWTVASEGLAAAWAANPLGLIVIALAAVVGGLVLAYNKFDWFHKLVDTVVHGVVAVFQWLWDVLVGHSIIPDIVAAFQALGDVFTWLWEHIFQPYINLLVKAFKVWWSVVKFEVKAAIAIFRVLGDTFKWLWQHIVQPILNFYGDKFKWLWQHVIQPYIGAIIKLFKGDFSGAFEDLKGIVSDVFGAIWNTVKELPGKLLSLVGKLNTAGVKMIKGLFDGLRHAGGEAGSWIAGLGKDIINGIIGVINDLTQHINDSIPNSISIKFAPDIDLPDNPIPAIPTLASGGRVSSPTLALIGEGSEAETVLPDSVLGSMLRRVAELGAKAAGAGQRFARQNLGVAERRGSGRGRDDVGDTLKAAGTRLRDFSRHSLKPFAEDWRKRTQESAETFKALGDEVHETFHKRAQPAMDDFLDWTRSKFRPGVQDLHDKVVKPQMDKISDKVRDTWQNKVRDQLTAMKDFPRQTMAPAFGTGADAIGNQWSKVENQTKQPVNYVIGTVYNRGLRRVMNTVASRLDGRESDLLPEVATLQAGTAKVPGSGRGDKVPALLEPGEVVIPRDRAEQVGYDQWDAIIRGKVFPAVEGAANQIRRYARGGAVWAAGQVQRLRRGGRVAAEGFADPERRVMWTGEPVTAINAAQLRVAEQLSRHAISVMQGSWQQPSTYSGTSHTGPGVTDTSMAGTSMFGLQAWLRKVAIAAWARNVPGAAQAGSGAHVHGVSYLDPGTRGNSQLAAFFSGGDGLGGRDYGPNPAPLHSLPQLLAQFGPVVSRQLAASGAVFVPPFVQRAMDQIQALSTAAGQHFAGGSPLQSAIAPAAQRATASALAWLTDHAGAIGGNGRAPWNDEVQYALGRLGQPLTLVGAVMQRLNQESAGNPLAVNKWDANWQAGHPSVGLMQVIESTFKSYAGPYRNTGPFRYGVSVDPVANIYAGLNYALHRYGNIRDPMLQDNGYDVGGWLRKGVTVAVNRSGAPEAVLTAAQSQAFIALGQYAERLLGAAAGAHTPGRPLGGGLLDSIAAAGHGDDVTPMLSVGTIIEEGAVRMEVHNPVGETTERTLNNRLRALGQFGLFDSGVG